MHFRGVFTLSWQSAACALAVLLALAFLIPLLLPPPPFRQMSFRGRISRAFRLLRHHIESTSLMVGGRTVIILSLRGGGWGWGGCSMGWGGFLPQGDSCSTPPHPHIPTHLWCRQTVMLAHRLCLCILKIRDSNFPFLSARNRGYRNAPLTYI